MIQFSYNYNHNLRSNNLMLRLAKPKTNAIRKNRSVMPPPTSGTHRVFQKETK
jgi:hypothetical protein